jgi:muramoyltetrapeptide carboxypeptidase
MRNLGTFKTAMFSFWALVLFMSISDISFAGGGKGNMTELDIEKETQPMRHCLQKGDKVALIAPSAAANEEAVTILNNLLEQAELVPLYFKEMNDPQSAPYANQYEQMAYASSDAKRLKGFQDALNSDSKAIWVLHGGSGSEKIIAALERGEVTLPKEKKIIIGFSGVTNLHLYFLGKGWPCLHGPVGTISKETYPLTHIPINTEASLVKVIDTLTGKSTPLSYPLSPLNEAAKLEKNLVEDTRVVGGALNILITHIGTPTALKGEGNIVFIEDEPQRPERIETMFMGLIRAGTFTGAKAVILGSFSDPNFNHERFKTVKPILQERLSNLLAENGINIPIFHADNFGHGDLNDPLPLGTKAKIQPGSPSLLSVDLNILSFINK